MRERDGCALLKQRFEAAGYVIQEAYRLDEDGIRVELDGFDPKARVGYEYVTLEAGDPWEVTEAVVERLGERMERGELFVLVVDEMEAEDAETLAFAADRFLERVRSLRR